MCIKIKPHILIYLGLPVMTCWQKYVAGLPLISSLSLLFYSKLMIESITRVLKISIDVSSEC